MASRSGYMKMSLDPSTLDLDWSAKAWMRTQ